MSRFDYIKYDEQSQTTQVKAKAECEKLEGLINTQLKDGRAKSLALTKLEEVYM